MPYEETLNNSVRLLPIRSVQPIWGGVKSLTYVNEGQLYIQHEALSEEDRLVVVKMKENFAACPETASMSPFHLAELAKVARLLEEEERSGGLSSLNFTGTFEDKCSRIIKAVQAALSGPVDAETVLKSFSQNLKYLSHGELCALETHEGLPLPFKYKTRKNLLEQQIKSVYFRTLEFKSLYFERVAEEFFKISENEMAAEALLEIEDPIYQERAWTHFLEFLMSRDKELDLLEMRLPKEQLELVLLNGLVRLFSEGKHDRACQLIKGLSDEFATKKFAVLVKMIQASLERVQINIAGQYAAAWPCNLGQYALIIGELQRKEQWNALILFLFDKRYLDREERLDLLKDLESILSLGRPLEFCSLNETLLEQTCFQNILNALVANHGKTREWAEETLNHYFPQPEAVSV